MNKYKEAIFVCQGNINRRIASNKMLPKRYLDGGIEMLSYFLLLTIM